MTISRLEANRSSLLVIDVQDKLLARMPAAEALVRDVVFLIETATLLEVPIVATEQYPKGLGPKTEAIARLLRRPFPEKSTFSCRGVPGLLDAEFASGRPQVVVCGMETHVCVLQTTLDLLEAGFDVYLPVDATQSRGRLDHDTAIRRLASAGAIRTTVETVAFEWLRAAAHPHFKAISRKIQDRMEDKQRSGSAF
jgi:nicotinamidase-related amidase